MAGELHNLMILGATSNAGKSLLATAFCRWFQRKGRDVQPFKSQNMSLNAVVTPEGDEIGVAQYVQALAACQIPSHLNNPILLKPQGGHVSQIIVKGQVADTLAAKDYYKQKDRFAKHAIESFKELEKNCDLVVLEGAGSPVELNLMDRDIANLFMARAAKAKIILVVNIELGGFFASTLGTLDLLPPEDRAQVIGVAVNNFRGDPSLFKNDLADFEKKIGLPILGVLPHLEDLALDVEDSVSLDKFRASAEATCQIRIVRLPHIANFNEFQIFEHCPGISWAFSQDPRELNEADIVILPGSKTTLDDLAWLKEKGFEEALKNHVAAGKKLLGICGGFQMMGTTLKDPAGIESQINNEAEGLGFFDMNTTFSNKKTLESVNCSLINDTSKLRAYELHMGDGAPSGAEDWLKVGAKTAGWEKNNLYGSYLHGLFENKAVLENILGPGDYKDMWQLREETFDRLADAIDEHLNTETILTGLNKKSMPGKSHG
jgi:adenosylcobyric acid synthase